MVLDDLVLNDTALGLLDCELQHKMNENDDDDYDDEFPLHSSMNSISTSNQSSDCEDHNE